MAGTLQSAWPSQATQVGSLPEPLGPGNIMKVTVQAAGTEAYFVWGEFL